MDENDRTVLLRILSNTEELMARREQNGDNWIDYEGSAMQRTSLYLTDQEIGILCKRAESTIRTWVNRWMQIPKIANYRCMALNAYAETFDETGERIQAAKDIVYGRLHYEQPKGKWIVEGPNTHILEIAFDMLKSLGCTIKSGDHL